MSKANNLRFTDREELNKLKKKFNFSLFNDQILVNSASLNRPTLHASNKNFKIYYEGGRSVTINKESIQLWKKLNYEISLLDIQYSYNLYRISYDNEKFNEETLKKYLNL